MHVDQVHSFNYQHQRSHQNNKRKSTALLKEKKKQGDSVVISSEAYELFKNSQKEM